MEFWGVEVKAGETLKVQPGEDFILHLSQAALGESKKAAEAVPLFVKIGDQKLALGSLSSASTPQLSFDLVFEKEFELSHNWKNGSVHFLGYKSLIDDGDDDQFPEYSDSDDSLDEDLPLAAEPNGKPEVQVPKAKEAAAKGKVKVVEPIKDDEDDSDEDIDSEDSDDDMLDSEDIEEGDEDDSEDEEDSEEDEETPTPKKAGGNKKRQAESASKTPVPAKKAKAATPQKTDGKKSGHPATPHPAKNAAKTPNDKVKTPNAAKTPKTDKAKSPKSGGDSACKSCSKTFKSEQAMEAHSKAKHSAGK